MKSPFPWFGGKSRIAPLVWERFGDVPNYVEPFFGSGAVLLNRPTDPGIETVNDLDCMVANFWRALQHDPAGVADAADWPVNEADQHARHLWLVSQKEFREKMKVEPDFYDAKIAGWWVWGQCIWIGAGWCSIKSQSLGDAGNGVHRSMPSLGDAGTGVHRTFETHGEGVPVVTREFLFQYMNQLAGRLRRVRVCCGDWSRVCGHSPTVKLGLTGVFLDPPYLDGRKKDIYSCDSLTVANDVREWAIAQGDDPRIRIALCGYEGEHAMPKSWECVKWEANCGYGSYAKKRGRENSELERVYFSPHCLPPAQESLFA